MPSRNWLNSDVTLARLKAGLEVLAVGHLNCRTDLGTLFSLRNRGAISRAVVSSLDGTARHFALCQSINNNQLRLGSVSTFDLEKHAHSMPVDASIPGPYNLSDLNSAFYRIGVPLPVMTSEAKRGDYCLLHSERVAVPKPGEAATANLETILGASHVSLQPETLLRADPLETTAKGAFSARAHAHKGEWPKIVKLM